LLAAVSGFLNVLLIRLVASSLPPRSTSDIKFVNFQQMNLILLINEIG